jgi:glycosyltransferase involved in cell wall biosynthesis
VNGRINVLHVCDKFGKAGATVHGVTRLISWWHPCWDRSRFSVEVVALRPADEAYGKLSEIIPDLRCLNKGKFDASTLTSLLKLIRERQTDILHLHGYGAHNFGRIAGRAAGVPVVLHEHFVDPGYPAYQSVADRLLRRIIDRGFAVSKSVSVFMTRDRHMPQEKVEVLYNGAPLRQFQRASADAVLAARERWGLGPDCLVLGTVGRLDPQKGNTFLIKALPQLVAKGHNVKVMIVGDGPLAGPLQQEARDLGVGEHVIFAGYQSDIPLILSLFDIQVFPSLYEGTPLTLFEAMAMGCAIVSTNVDGLGEILTDERNALLVGPSDVDGLAAALDRVLSSTEIRSRLATNAMEDVQRFDVQAMVDRMQAVYLELLRATGKVSAASA